MTQVRIRLTGRVVVTDDDIARRWVAEGYAELVETDATETASRTPTPQPATRQDIEHR